MKHLRLVRSGREPDTIACKDEPPAVGSPSLSRGVAPASDGASRPVGFPHQDPIDIELAKIDALLERMEVICAQLRTR